MTSNFSRLGAGFYIVRTQAGFKQALKNFGAYENVHGYPSSYPSLIALSDGYQGYHYTRVNSIHLNALLAEIAASEGIGPDTSTREKTINECADIVENFRISCANELESCVNKLRSLSKLA